MYLDWINIDHWNIPQISVSYYSYFFMALNCSFLWWLFWWAIFVSGQSMLDCENMYMYGACMHITLCFVCFNFFPLEVLSHTQGTNTYFQNSGGTYSITKNPYVFFNFCIYRNELWYFSSQIIVSFLILWQYSLAKDVVSLLKKPKTFGSQFKRPPLVRYRWGSKGNSQDIFITCK